MNISKKIKMIFVIALMLSSSSQAATFYYSFDKNITKFTYPITPEYESLSDPYAQMTVFDEIGGVGLSLVLNPNYRGSLAQIDLNYISELSQVPYKNPFKSTFKNDNLPYYYSDQGGITSNGFAISGITYQLVSIFFDVNLKGNNLNLHFRNLPNNLTAAVFSPRYLEVENTTWGKFNGTALVLASQASGPIFSVVPENTLSIQLLLGLLTLIFIRKKIRVLQNNITSKS